MVANIGSKFKKITSLLKWNIDHSDTFTANPELTNVTGWTIGYISRRMKNGIETYQKDIEKEFKISRSTASGLLANMEEHGYIVREISEIDNRLKRIILTEKSIELHNKVINTFDEVERTFLTGFSDDEKKELINYLTRIEINLEKKREVTNND